MLDDYDDIEGFVLAGGASSRMGLDKALLRFGQSTFIERAAQTLGAVTTKPIVIVGRESIIESSNNFRFLPDSRNPTAPNLRGAIIGLQTIFSNSKTVWAAILACDLPFASGDLLKRLASLRSPESEAIVPIQPDGRWQPLCALYRSEMCLPHLEKMLAENVWSVKELLPRVHTRTVEFAEIADLPNAENFFLNVNTPAEYELARQLEFDVEQQL